MVGFLWMLYAYTVHAGYIDPIHYCQQINQTLRPSTRLDYHLSAAPMRHVLIATVKGADESAVDAALDFLKQQGPEARVVAGEIPGEGEGEDVTQKKIDDDVEEERKLLRKIDWMIVPLAWACYTLQYLDKTLSLSALIPPDSISFCCAVL